MSHTYFDNQIRLFSNLLYDKNIFNIGDPTSVIEHGV